MNNCTDCETLLTPEMKQHAEDKYTPDHKGLCCDCFDVSLGAYTKIKLDKRTPVRLHDHDDYE